MVSLFHLFSGTCYSGYDDDDDEGFWEVYGDAFEDLGQAEIDGFEAENGKNVKGCPTTPPPFGTSKSNWDEVGAFYNYWECFFTALGFSWCDKYDSRDANDRRVRRAIDAENAKARKAGKREYSDQVVQLVYFIKKRDPRVKKHKEDMEKEKKVKEQLRKEEEARQKVLRKEAMERWKVEAAEEEAKRILEDRDRIRVRLDDLDSDEEAGGYTGGGNGGRRKKKGRKKVSRGEKWRGGNQGDDEAPTPAPLHIEFSQYSPERKWTKKKVKTRPKEKAEEGGEAEEGMKGGGEGGAQADPLGIKVWAAGGNEGEEGEGVGDGMASAVAQQEEVDLPLPPPPAVSKRPEIDTSYSYIYKEDHVYNVDIINLKKVDLDDTELDEEAEAEAVADVIDELYMTDEEEENAGTCEVVGEEEEDTVVVDVWKCEMCSKVFKSEGQHKSHMRSKKHKEMEKEMERQRKRMERAAKKANAEGG